MSIVPIKYGNHRKKSLKMNINIFSTKKEVMLQ